MDTPTPNIPPKPALPPIPDIIIQPPRNWRGVTVMLLFGIIGNLAAAVLQALGNSVLGSIIAIVGVVLLLLALRLPWLRKPTATLKVLALPNDQPARSEILIVLVGPGLSQDPNRRQSAWKAVEYHQKYPDGRPCLRECWVVTSDGAGGGLPNAQQLKSEFEPQGITVEIRKVKDAFTIQETYDVVRKIIEDEIWKSKMFVTYDGVIADVTGATTPMSIGMVLACQKRVRMQYMYGGRDIASQPIELRFVQSTEVIS